LLPELSEVRRKVVPEKSPVKDLMGIVQMTVKHPEIKWFMLYPAIYASFTMLLMWLLQPAMQNAGVAISLFGLFVGVNQFSRIIFAKNAHWFYKVLGAQTFIKMMPILLVVGVLCVFGMLWSNSLILTYILTVIMAVVPATQQLSKLVMNTYIHHRIKSTERGTVLSVNQMYNAIICGIAMVLMKPLLDGVGLEWTMAIILVAITVLYFPMKKMLSIKDIDKIEKV
jgi:hypothetical protein